MTTKEHAQGNEGAVPNEGTKPSDGTHRHEMVTGPAARRSPFTNSGIQALNNVMKVRRDRWECNGYVSMKY